ncbi:hypothetical protein FI667_g5315, partial [Globisporangium splendens]
MPSLLSPRSSSAAAATAAAAVMMEGEDTKTLKKKKSVMMRLKSKISNTLSGGKKKSFVGDTSPTDNDVLKKLRESPETTVTPQHEKRSEADDVAHSQQESEETHRDNSYAEKEDTSTADDSSVVEAAIEPFDVTQVDDEYDDDHDDSETVPVSAATTAEPILSKNHQEQDGDEEVFAFDYKTSVNSGGPQEEVYDDRFDDDADYEEDKLEVFHESSASVESLGNQTLVSREHDTNSSSKHHQQQEEEEGEEREPETGLGRLDLVVVGMSSLKTMRGGPPPVSSPVKKSVSSPMPKPASSRTTSPGSPRSELSAKPVEPSNDQLPSTLAPKTKPRGGIEVDFLQEDSDIDIKGDGFTRERPVKMKAPPQFSSAPVRHSSRRVDTSPEITQQPLLSDFQFGSAESSATAMKDADAKDSPAKRRGATTNASLLPPMRKSLSRDQESRIMGHGGANATSSSQMPPSPKTKKTRVGSSSTFKQSEPALQGIQEEQSSKTATVTTGDRPASPRKVTRESSVRRRSSCMMDAPILASAFVASTDPESHDEQQQYGIASTGEEVEGETDTGGDGCSSSSGAFAFDAGAAITQEFGERVARLLGADPWGDRQDGFDAIVYIVKKADLASAKNKRELFCAALAAIQCGVDDRVAPVMYCALECLRAVLKEFAPVIDRTFVKYAPTNEQLSALVKSLTAKLGDSNKRTQRETSQALIRVAKQKKLKPLPHVLLHLSAKEVAPRIQVATLRQLVSELGVDSKRGLSLDVAMQFAVPALKIADEKTRKAAVELIADLQLNNPNGGATVTAQLVGIKPEMLQQQAAQSTNQSEEARGGVDGDLDDQRSLELVPVPSEDAKKVIAMVEFQLQQAAGVIGPVAWRKLESKTCSDRKEALVDIDKLMADDESNLDDHHLDGGKKRKLHGSGDGSGGGAARGMRAGQWRYRRVHADARESPESDGIGSRRTRVRPHSDTTCEQHRCALVRAQWFAALLPGHVDRHWLVSRELQAAAREMMALDVTEVAVNVTFDFTLSFSLTQQVDRDVGDIATPPEKSLGLLTVFPEQVLEETIASHCAELNLINRVCLKLHVGIRNQVSDLWGCVNETHDNDAREAAKSSEEVAEASPSPLVTLPSASPSSDEFTHSDADNVTVIQVPVRVDDQELAFVLRPTQDLDLEVALFCRKHSVPRDRCGMLLREVWKEMRLSSAFPDPRPSSSSRQVATTYSNTSKKIHVTSPDPTRLYSTTHRVYIELDAVTHATQDTNTSSNGLPGSPSEREEICIYGNYMPTPSICGEVPFPDKVFFEAYQLLLGHHFLLFLPKRVVMRDNATEPLSLEHVSVDDSEWLGAVHLEVVMPSVKLVAITLETKMHPVLATPQTYLDAEIHTMYFDESDALYRLCILHNDDFDCVNTSKLTILDTNDSGSEDHDYVVNRSLTIHAPIFDASTGVHEIAVMLVNEFGNASAVSNTVIINVDLTANAEPLPHDPAAMIDASAFVQKRPSSCPEPLATTLHDSALAWICELWRHEWGQFSQNGEDGVLKSIFYNIGTTSKQYVEFGTEDGSQCNTRYWRENYGWSGLLMDGRYASEAINLHREFVTAENINALFAKYNVSRQIDLLSIDVDFNDYWILDAIDRDRFAPRVIVIEYNAHIPPNEARSVKYKADAVWDGRTDFFGRSMGALFHWGVRNSYSLLYCESHGVNCFLVHNDALMGVNVSAFLHPEDVFAPPNFFGKGWSYPNASRPGDGWVWL